MKNAFVKFLPLLTLLLLLTVQVSAEEISGTCGEGIAWTLEQGVLTISGNGPMENFEASAPWDDHREEIARVVIDGNVTTIGDNAFRDYDSLEEVDLGSAMHTLGKHSFQGCDALVRISLPDTFKIFDEECLRDCGKLTAIHCYGTFPSFKENCLWGSYVKIYYPAERPWPVSLIQQLEEAFHGRIEFLDSNGNDPYTPQEETEPSVQQTEETTSETATQQTTEAPAQEPTQETTEETVEATNETTMPETQQTETQTSFPYTMPTEEEKPERKSSSGIGLALVGLVLSAAGLGMLLVRTPKKKGKYQK